MSKQQDLFDDMFDTAEGEEDEDGLPTLEASEKVTYEDFDAEKLYVYAGIDCIGTSELLAEVFPKIVAREQVIEQEGKVRTVSKAPPIIESFLGLEIPSHEFLIDLEINGMGYSIPRNEYISKKMVAEIAALDDKIFSQIGEKVDLNSGKAIAEFLYVKKGFEVPHYTKSGDPATDGAAILKLAGLDPLGGKYVTQDTSLQYLADMAKRRDISSVHNTFIKTYVKDFVKRDGRIHPSYNQFGTSSFRITGSDPNLTQLPRPRHGYNVRSCFKEDDGYVFISFDFSSAEVKILGNISKDPAMLVSIAEGLDFHIFSASRMYGIPYEEMATVLKDQNHPKYKDYKNKRQTAKVLTFSIVYGSSPAGIAMQLNMTKEAAEDMISLYFKLYPGIKRYVDDSHRFALNNQLSITPLGQRRLQPGTYPCFRPTASFNGSLRGSQNYGIQSTTSTIGLVTFAELNERIKKFGAIGTCTVNVGGPAQR